MDMRMDMFPEIEPKRARIEGMAGIAKDNIDKVDREEMADNEFIYD